jgi:hypothetical protein
LDCTDLIFAEDFHIDVPEGVTLAAGSGHGIHQNFIHHNQLNGLGTGYPTGTAQRPHR